MAPEAASAEGLGILSSCFSRGASISMLKVDTTGKSYKWYCIELWLPVVGTLIIGIEMKLTRLYSDFMDSKIKSGVAPNS